MAILSNNMVALLFLSAVIYVSQTKALAVPLPLILTDEPAEFKFGPFVEFIEDREKNFNIQDVSSVPFSSKWSLPKKQPPHFKFTNSGYWFRFRVDTTHAKRTNWILDVGFHFFMKAILYIPKGDGKYELHFSGKMTPYAFRDVQHRTVAFKIPSEKALGTYYLYLETPGAMKLPGSVLREVDFTRDKANVLFAIYAGIAIAIVLYNAILYLKIRDKSYLYYVLYAGLLLMVGMDIEGYSSQYFWPNSPWWSQRSAGVLAATAVFFALNFSRSYLDTKHLAPRLDSWLKYCAFIEISYAVLFLFRADYIVTRFSQVIISLSALAAFVIGVALLRKTENAKYFVFAFAGLVCGAFIFSAQNFNLIPPNAFTQHATYFGSALELVLLSFGLANRISKLEKESFHVQLEMQKVTTIEQTARMFAHDVRKPFGLIRMGVESIRAAKTLEDKTKATENLAAAAGKAMDSVDAMIKDVLSMGVEPHLEIGPVSLQEILDDSLEELNPELDLWDIEIKKDLNHTRLICVDRVKIQRVISNLAHNAVQAMLGVGKISIESADILFSGRTFIKISVRNSNSYIPEADREKIFESYFSRGKSGGTGLGLAICKRIVEKHEGRIWVESVNLGGGQTVFHVTLPACFETQVEKNSSKSGCVDDSVSEVNFVDTLRLRMLSGEKTLRVLVIDDDQEYLSGMESMLTSDSFRDLFEVTTARNSKAALIKIYSHRFDVCITDIDLGPASLNGFELVQEIKKVDQSVAVLFHSDSYESEECPERGEFLRKPFSKERFSQFLLEKLSLKEISAKCEQNILPWVVVVDDEKIVLSAWTDAMDDANVMGFIHSEYLVQKIEQELDFLEKVSIIILDFNFSGFNVVDIGLVPFLRSKGFSGPIILSTYGIYGENVEKHFDAVIDKNPISWKKLCSKLPGRFSFS